MATLDAGYQRFIGVVVSTSPATPAAVSTPDQANAFKAAIAAAGIQDPADFAARAIHFLITKEAEVGATKVSTDEQIKGLQEQVATLQAAGGSLQAQVTTLRGKLDQSHEELSTVNSELRTTSKSYQALLAAQRPAHLAAAASPAQNVSTTMPVTQPTEDDVKWATKALDQLPEYGDSPHSVSASLQQHKDFHGYLLRMPERFKIVAHARKATGKHAEFIRTWYTSNTIRQFTTFAEYEAAINNTKPQGEPPVLEALRELDGMRYRAGKKVPPSKFVSDFRAALDRAQIPRDSWSAAWLFSRTLPDTLLQRTGSQLTLALRSGSFDKMVEQFLAVEDPLVTRASPYATPPAADLPVDDPMDIGAVATDALALPHLKCHRCGGVGHVAKRCGSSLAAEPSGKGTRA